jgi:hypothetical protein
MSMKTHQILCQHTGEISYTSKDPVAVWAGQVDLTEQQDCILSSDDWRPVSVPKWEVREVTLPDWLSPEGWIRDSVYWKYCWGSGVDREWPEGWQRGLLRMNTAERLACVKLLKVKTFRSEFRASLRDQLEKWLETPSDLRQHNSPFSTRQWDCLIDDRLAREAKYVDEGLYRSR